MRPGERGPSERRFPVSLVRLLRKDLLSPTLGPADIVERPRPIDSLDASRGRRRGPVSVRETCQSLPVSGTGGPTPT